MYGQIELLAGCAGLCFILGYAIAALRIKARMLRNPPPRPNYEDKWREPAAKRTASREQHYRTALGISATATETEIKAAYRRLLAKYHPDKVAHLGEEFRVLASARTQYLIEAYEYFRTMYGFR